MNFNRFAIDRLIDSLTCLPGTICDITLLKWDEIADYSPDPDRFSVREIIAHLADFDVIFLDRFIRTCTEQHPTLPSVDEAELAVRHQYATLDTAEQYRLLCERRANMVSFLQQCDEASWARPAERPGIGTVDLQQQLVITAMHDNYHIHQLVHWVAQFHSAT